MVARLIVTRVTAILDRNPGGGLCKQVRLPCHCPCHSARSGTGRPSRRTHAPAGKPEKIANIDNLRPIAATDYRLIGLASGDLPMGHGRHPGRESLRCRSGRKINSRIS